MTQSGEANVESQNRRLPSFYAITAPLEADGSATPLLEQAACREWLRRFEALLAADLELIQLRAKALSQSDLRTLAAYCQVLAAGCESSVPPRLSRAKARSYMDTEALQNACRSDVHVATPSGKAPPNDCRSDVHVATPSIRVLLNGPPELVSELGMAGVHLTSKALADLDTRPLPKGFLVGASCHAPEELAHAAAIGCDFACLSPVKVTKGYSERETLGFDRFAEWVSGCEIPVYGLGGLGREDLDEIQNAGGQGVAGISAFWR